MALALQPYRLVLVSGQSMEPTLRDLQLVVARPPVRPVESGDVVVFPLDGERCVKRVVAGQGSVYESAAGGARLLVGNGQVVVQGDNPGRSFDSRQFGPIDASKIELVVVFPAGSGLAKAR